MTYGWEEKSQDLTSSVISKEDCILPVSIGKKTPNFQVFLLTKKIYQKKCNANEKRMTKKKRKK